MQEVIRLLVCVSVPEFAKPKACMSPEAIGCVFAPCLVQAPLQNQDGARPSVDSRDADRISSLEGAFVTTLINAMASRSPLWPPQIVATGRGLVQLDYC